MKDITVHHCLLVREGRIDESWQTSGQTANGPYVLRGVRYDVFVDPDIEFPTVAKPPWTVYLRITGENVGPTRVLFRVHYQNPQGVWEHILRREMDRAIPFPDDGTETHDMTLNLPYLRFGGIGLHAITAHFWYDGMELDESDRFPDGAADTVPEWMTEPEEMFRTPGWAYRALDYFWVGRHS